MTSPFHPFNYAQAANAGTQNALAQMKGRQVAMQLRNAPEDRRNVIRDMEVKRAIDGFTLAKELARTARDQNSWSMGVKKLEGMGIMQPGFLPKDYNADYSKSLYMSADKQIEKFGQPQTVMQGDKTVLTQFGNLGSSKVVEGFKPKPDKKKANSSGIKAFQMTAIERQIARYFPEDALYDANGNFVGLKEKSVRSPKINKAITKAVKMFRGDRSLVPQEAADIAARETGLLSGDDESESVKNASRLDPMGLFER